MDEKGRTPAQARPDGILVVDKPGGISSAALVAKVKRALGVKKIGHAGTLDPLATGVMVCCINRATKLARFLLGGDKRYEATLLLGIETDTQDAAGEVTGTHEVPEYPEEQIGAVLAGFAGEIEQAPPVYSALKHNGVPLYRLARQGRPVQKPPRKVTIRSIRILEVALPAVRFEVTCSAGTYVRALCADIGAVLGCGGHMKDLKRTMACGFCIEDAVSLDGLQELAASGRGLEPMIPMADTLQAFAEVVADPEVAAKIRHGQTLYKQELDPADGSGKKYIKVVDTDHRLLAVLSADDNKNTYNYECVLM
jgi:tRNA pseudouridine55 synthase